MAYGSPGYKNIKSINFFTRSSSLLVKSLSVLSVSFFLFLFSQASYPMPQGGVVVGGNANAKISTSGNNMQINQSADRAIINWQKYNISQQEHVHYQQPSSSSIVLNRINPAGGTSQIFGKLTANGQVWLINPAGIWFGPSSYVNVGGLLATTANISDENFMAGRFIFTQDPAYSGSVINEGYIKTSEAGLVALIGSGVVNNGRIEASLGTVVLASGSQFTINFSGNELISFTVDKEVLAPAHDQNNQKLSDGVNNSGVIMANGGKILMTAHDASHVLDNAINMKGVAEAKSVGVHNGELVLLGEGQSTVKVSGKLIASGKNVGEKGGKVKVQGNKIEIVTAEINVSGTNGGGEILIGGDYQGKNPAIKNAESTHVAQDVILKADAMNYGNGGKIIVWANNDTQFHGKISARGGALGGNGGFVETSGKNKLDVSDARVDTLAPYGLTGTWLLDPTNIYIATNQANATAAGMSGTDSSANTANAGTFAASGAVQDSLLTTGNLTTALGSSNVIVTTTNTSGTGTGNITVVDAFSWSGTNSLTLTAANNLIINGAITTGAAGSALILNATGAVTQSAAIGGSGNVTKNGAGTFTMSQANTYSGSTTVNEGGITLSGNGTATSTTFTVNQGANLTLDNSGTNNTNRISDSNALTLNGGEFKFISPSSGSSSESIGALTLPYGYSTVTMLSNGASTAQLTFASISRSTGATVLFRGTNLGNSGGSSPTNINFTTATGLGLVGGNTTATNKPIVPFAMGDTSATGTGTGFVTYNINPSSNAANTSGIRPLSTSTEYALNTFTSGANVRVTTTTNVPGANTALNSLLLDGGSMNYNANRTMTITSGAVARIGTGDITSTNSNTRILAFSTVEAIIHAINPLTIASNITGSGGLTKSGSGTLTLDTQVKTLTGNYIINSGNLTVGFANALATTNTVTVANAGTFAIGNFSQSVAGLTLYTGGTVGAAATMGTGVLTDTGVMTVNVNGSGATGATISRTSTGTLAFTGNSLTVNNGNALDDLTISTVISNVGTFLNKLGAGQLTLSGTNTYTGVTVASGGILSVATIGNGGVAGNLGQATNAAANIQFNGGTIQYTGSTASTNRAFTIVDAMSGAIDVSQSGTNLTISGASASSTGSLSKTGLGTLTLSGANLYSGTTTVNQGTLAEGVNNALLSGGLTVSGGTFNIGTFTDTVGAVSLTSGSITGSTGVLTGTSYGVESGTISAILNGSGNLTKSNTGTVTLSGVNTFSGTTIINGGTLSIGADSNLGTAPIIPTVGKLAFGGGTLQTTASFTLNSNRGISLNSGGGTISPDASTTLTYNGILNGANAFTKAGSGTLSLGGVNLNSGATNVNAGILSITGVSGLGATTGTTVSSGATLDFTLASLTLLNTNTITLNGSGQAGAGALTLSGNGATIINNPITLASNSTIGGNGSGAKVLGGAISGNFDLNIALPNAGISLPAINLSSAGSLAVTTGGAIIQTGALTIPGSASFNAGANAITLANTSNNFGGMVFLNNTGSGNAVALTNSGALNLGTSNVGGTLAVIAGGNVSQSGAITATGGITTITSTALNSDISLGSFANNFGTFALAFGGTLTNIRDISINNTNASAAFPTLTGLTNLRNLTLNYSNAAINFANNLTLTNSGSLNITAGGDITQSATKILTVPGTASFTAGAHAINLPNDNAISGAVTFSNSGANDVYFKNNAALTLAASSIGRNLTAVANGTLTLSGAISGTNTGGVLEFSGSRFVNSVGSSAITPASGGRFLVWSSNANPFGGGTPDNRNGLAYDFKQYNATFGVTSPSGSGNGFLYTLAPTIVPSLTGTVSKTYNATTAATLAAGNYTFSGAVDSDTVTLNNPSSGTYDDKNVGTGKTVSVTGVAIASASNGAATVYGYAISPTSINGAVGTITQAALTISSNSGQTKVYGNDDPVSAKTAYGITSGTLFGSDALTGEMGRNTGELVGNYNFTQNTVGISDGNSGNNYALTFNGATNKFNISQRSLTASIANQSKTYGADDPSISGIGVTLGNVVNRTVTDINGNSTPINDTANVSGAVVSLTRATGENYSATPYAISGGTFSISGSASGNYNSSPSFTGSPTLTINKANLSGSVADQSKVYGADDPSLPSAILSGQVNRTVTDWMGNPTVINDTAPAKVASTFASLTRATGEIVGDYNITAGTFNSLTGTSAANYNVPSFVGGNKLTITQAPLNGSVADQSKVYGQDDPALPSAILSGQINRTVTDWMGNPTVINDTAPAKVAATFASLVRATGETIGDYNITAGTFNSLTGTSAGNYSAPSFVGGNKLTITKASLTGSVLDQSKVYGQDDPSLPAVTLAGQINRTVTDWMGNPTVINDTAPAKVAVTLASLVRQTGENVGDYNITSGTFNSLTGTSAGNYNVPSFVSGNKLTITQAPLNGSVADQSKVYGQDDPALPSAILSGQINRTVTDWMGNPTVINDTAPAKVAATFASLVRATGETIGDYNITSGTFNSLTGTSAGNYSAPSFVGGNKLTITKASLTGSVLDQSKVYGQDDPSLPAVTLAGQINRTVTDWMGNPTVINDTAPAKVAVTLASLVRQTGEIVGDYNITSGTFNSLTGTSSGNYNVPSLAAGSKLSITQASLTGSVADQSKVYGADDPALPSAILSGQINRTVTDWMGNPTVINDTAPAKVAATFASLVRQTGEIVGDYNITSGTFNSLTGTSAGNYSAPSFVGGNKLTITKANLSGSVLDQSKVYGQDDPSLPAVTLAGQINRTVTDWMGNPTVINDTAPAKVAATLASLVRQTGENVGDYNITSGTFNSLTGTSAGNYNVPSLAAGSKLSITQASLTGSVADQSKVYGADDPALPSAILSGQINRTVTDWMGNPTAINDTAPAKVAATFASLVRQTGEIVGDYNITSGTFNSLTGTSAGNYSAPSFVGGNKLTITKASLTGSVADQSKVYGQDDPALPSAILSGQINRTVTDWMGNPTVINDTAPAKVAATFASLVRQTGEIVGDYNITSGTFNSLTGTSSGNYNAPSFVGGNKLTITKASLSGSVADQSKVYGADDPSLPSAILSGQINRTVTDWMGNPTVINDTAPAKVAATLASLVRATGETVGDYSITSGTFNSLTGTSAGNYSAPSFVGGNKLTITKASLTGSVLDQSKIYGEDDPALPAVTLAGQVNRTVTDWMGNPTVINDTAASKVDTTLLALTRVGGENAGDYNITSGTFSALTGTSAANYNDPSFVTGYKLSINKASSLNGSITDQSKVYGTDDPALPAVTLSGQIHTAVTDWMGNRTNINDTLPERLSSTLASLTRDTGETVGDYDITAGTFNLAGTSAGNYNPASFVTGSKLTITKANLSGSIIDQSKVYGEDDPALPNVTLAGKVNRTVTNWMGGTTNINDNAASKVSVTLASLVRDVGETAGEYDINSAVFNALTGTRAGNYNAPSFVTGSKLTIDKASSLTGSITDQSKIYGQDDPALPAVTLAGQVNRTVTDWMGNPTIINDTAPSKVAATLASLARDSGEIVGDYDINSGVFNLTGSNAANYNSPTLATGSILTINKASSLTGSVTDQSKVYGQDDPALPNVTLTGQVNRLVTNWMNHTTTINDTSAVKVDVTLASLTRNAGETAGDYTITSGVLNALTGSRSANYNAPSFVAGSKLTINKASSLTGSITDQSKIYGQDDPALPSVSLAGQVNRTVTDWMGNPTIIDDTSASKVAGTLASLARDGGETVGDYDINSGVFNALTGSSADNYNTPTLATGSKLTINKASSLTGSVVDQSKVYGQDDPALPNVILDGKVNRTVTNWMGGTTVINDTTGSKVAVTLASLARDSGETIGDYDINSGVFNALTGSRSGNYNAPIFVAGSKLTINKASSLTGSITDQSKIYGQDDPSLPAVTLAGQVNRTVTDWMGNPTIINDTAASKVAATLASLARDSGETVGDYDINSGVFNTLTGSSANNYNTPILATGSKLTINKSSSLTGSVADQTKIYGEDDPTLPNVTLAGKVNRTVTNWMGGTTIIDDTIGSRVAVTLASLVRASGENIGDYNINSGVFNALTGSRSANYNAPVFVIGSKLTINKASGLTGSITDQTKVYGQNDPSLPAVTLAGQVNRTVTDWMGNPTAINDTSASKVAVTLASLERSLGENVGSRNITDGTFNSLTGTSAGNYNAPSFVTGSKLIITKASLTGSILDQTKEYGSNDPNSSGIHVDVTGLINRTVSTWNGDVSIDNSGLNSHIDDISRAVGENVGNYAINVTYTAPSSNYFAPVAIGSPILTITQADLTASVANQDKIYGQDDPQLSSMAVNLNGLINRTASTWNGSVIINDTGLSSSVLSLTRDAGENIGNYQITAGSFSAPSGNYMNPTLVGNHHLDINKADLIINANPASKIYGSADPAFTYNQNGLVQRNVITWNGITNINDQITGSLTRNPGENVGNYLIKIGNLTAGNNYDMNYTSNNLVINPATLNYNSNAVQRIYGSANPNFDGNVTGFVNGETMASATTGQLTFTSAATDISNVGNYAITGSGLNANHGNYVFVQALDNASALKINPATLLVLNAVANNKSFNGATNATVNFNNATLNGVLFSDIVNLNSASYSANFQSSLPGNNIPVNVTNLKLTGSASDNYVLVQPLQLSANILAPPEPPIPPIPPTPVGPDIAQVVNQTNSIASNNQSINGSTPNSVTQMFKEMHDNLNIKDSKQLANGCISVGTNIEICGAK